MEHQVQDLLTESKHPEQFTQKNTQEDRQNPTLKESHAEALRFENVSKIYRLYHRPYHRLLEILLKRPYHQRFVALQDIDLSIAKGESVALIGENGAGKSTFLKIATGISPPSEGSVRSHGRIGALLELGAGFHPDFSGRDNVFLNAAILGFTDSEIRERYPGIVDFAELAPFMDQPVKTYSTGMYVRLAFAIAITMDPEILVIDEALAVGDVRFQKKCIDRIEALRKRKKTVLFCSHSMYQVRQLCERAVWLKNGKAVEIGNADKVVSDYLEYMDCKENNGAPPPQQEETPSFNPLFAEVSSTTPRMVRVEFLDDSEKAGTRFENGSRFRVRVHGLSNGYRGLCSLIFSITLNKWQVFGSSSLVQKKTFPVGGKEFCVEIDFPSLPLLSGNFYFNTYLSDEAGLCLFDFREQTDLFRVDGTQLEPGVVHIDHHWIFP